MKGRQDQGNAIGYFVLKHKALACWNFCTKCTLEVASHFGFEEGVLFVQEVLLTFIAERVLIQDASG